MRAFLVFEMVLAQFPRIDANWILRVAIWKHLIVRCVSKWGSGVIYIEVMRGEYLRVTALICSWIIVGVHGDLKVSFFTWFNTDTGCFRPLIQQQAMFISTYKYKEYVSHKDE